MARNVDIKLRRSAVPGRVPLVDQLNLGELAVNTADGKLYLKRAYDGVEQVIEVGGDARSGLVSTFNTYIYTSDGTLQNITGADDYGNYLSYDLASPRRIQVYLNGVLLHQGIDYTAIDGSSISLGYPVDEGMVVQIAAYNSDGASIDADLILDDGFSFTVGTDEETKFYHNGSNTVIKHNAYGDNTFKMLWRDSDRLEMGEFGISLTGNLTINGNTVVTDSDVLVSINDVVTKQYVEDLNLDAGAIAFDDTGTDMNSTNVQEAIDHLHSTKLDINSLTSAITFFPTTTFVDIDGGYTQMVTSLDDSDFNTTPVDINTGLIDSDRTFIAQLVSDAGVLVGSTGIINVHTVGNVRRHEADGTGDAEFFFEVYKIDSDLNETLLATSSMTDVVSDIQYGEFQADALLQNTLFNEGDRVAFKYYGVSRSSNITSFDFQFGGSQPVRSTFPVPLSVIPQEAKFASDIISLTANFDGVLSGNDDTVQKALETIDGMTTSVVTEGNNLYFTDERARLAVDGSSTIDYNSTTGVISANTNILATRNYAEAYAEAVSDSDSLVTLLSANNYTDQAISDLDSDFNSELNNLQSAVDSDLLVLETSLQSNIDSAYDGAIAHADTVALNAVTTAETYTDSAISLALTNLVDGAPEVLDTLNELAEAMGNDSDFVGTVQNWINQKLDKTATTDVITEGANNQYFTEERSRNSVSAGNGLLYNPVTGEFSTDSSYDAVFNSVTSSVFVGDLNGTATNANQLDGQDGSYYRINVYDQTGNLIN